ncbi:protein kinase domain-containing protein [Chondromyces apiculatus]|uniref:Serine/threonine protein kinase n=1 Tax=Chondromyces apiculatus DSM 436 TaxID=1192034 RepID=A0A017SWG0_9BACT|nr:protein kinase [Chondromyces apiculatus]EYF01067.1 serine/threonine protein kinase [Chondromyces apiculatus DSM 436]
MPKPGDTFERYKIEAAIGEGGMGAVYRAHDARLGRRVALKVLTGAATGEEAGARLLREARAAAALDHPNAVSIFDIGEIEGAPYIAMELVPGQTLRAVLEEQGGAQQAQQAQRISWLVDVARVLGVAHKRGLVHRDIKPENVMVREDGVVKVLDFGIARRTGGGADPSASTQSAALPTLTTEGVKPGTPVYMAPEQIRGEPLDGRADQFAWGVLAYELLTGKAPWRGGTDVLAVLASVLTDEVDEGALAGAPPAVRAAVMRALERRPEKRFGSMEALVQALEGAAVRAGSAPALEDAAAHGSAGEGVDARPSGAPAPQSATLAQRYATVEVDEVLAQAIQRQAEKRGDTRLSFDELLAVATEVGVDAESVREASRALRERKAQEGHQAQQAQQGPERRGADALAVRRADEEGALVEVDDAAEREAWIRRQRRGWQRHFGIYVIVNVALSGLLLLTNAPAVAAVSTWLLWGIGVAIHGLVALTRNEDDWADHKRSKKWWKEHQRRHHELAMAAVRSGGGRGPARFGAEARAKGKGRKRVEALDYRVPPLARISEEEAMGRAMAEEEAARARVEVEAEHEAERLEAEHAEAKRQRRHERRR